MRYYPVFLDIRNRPCLVVGGGSVAARKAASLIAAGARVTVIAERPGKAVRELARGGSVTLKRKAYGPGDAKGYFILIAATDSAQTNRAAASEARAGKALVNVVDDPAECGFIVPSIIDRGALMVAISTSGQSPALARGLREELERHIGGEYETFLAILAAARKKLLKTRASRDKKERIIKDLVKSPLPRLIREGRAREINALLKAVLGDGTTLSGLGVKLARKDGK